ncbi:MAG: alpha/beta hydrolase [Bryobacterales bacterium]|nr:alpha/beta hydrolase [Bryobacterales bacterium]
MIHGGFWRAAYDLSRAQPFCEYLQREGIATFSLEYRRVGNPGGGWPGTLDDVRAAGVFFGREAGNHGIDLRRIAVAGHSAGGQLALWLAGERVLPLRGAVSLAGAADLRRAWELQLGKGAAAEFLGGSPAQYPERYQAASPVERLPLVVPARLIHGTEDHIVPLEISEAYAVAARSVNDDVELLALPGVGHAELIDPDAEAFREVVSTLAALLR